MTSVLRKYSPDQPRAPKGSGEGGQWTDSGFVTETDRQLALAYIDNTDNPEAFVSGFVSPSGKLYDIRGQLHEQAASKSGTTLQRMLDTGYMRLYRGRNGYVSLQVMEPMTLASLSTLRQVIGSYPLRPQGAIDSRFQSRTIPPGSLWRDWGFTLDLMGLMPAVAKGWDVVIKEWGESQHPRFAGTLAKRASAKHPQCRWPAGTPGARGGEFAPAGAGYCGLAAHRTRAAQRRGAHDTPLPLTPQQLAELAKQYDNDHDIVATRRAMLEDAARRGGKDSFALVHTPERQELHQQMLRDYLRDGRLANSEQGDTAVPEGERLRQRVLHVVWGGPGSGKSTFARNINGTVKGLLIDADEFKLNIPGYTTVTAAGSGSGASYTHRESAFLADLALERGLERGDNLIFTGLGKTERNAVNMIRMAQRAGYRVIVHRIATPVPRQVEQAVARWRRARAEGRVPRFLDPYTVALETGHRPERTFARLLGRREFRDIRFNEWVLEEGTRDRPGRFRLARTRSRRSSLLALSKKLAGYRGLHARYAGTRADRRGAARVGRPVRGAAGIWGRYSGRVRRPPIGGWGIAEWALDRELEEAPYYGYGLYKEWDESAHLKRPVVKAQWDESDHPRHPAGSPEGGEFRALLERRAASAEGLVLYHETPGDAALSIRWRGLQGEMDSTFATVGRPSGFVTSRVKTVTRFRARPEHIFPDMRYDPDAPYADLLRQHPDLVGADVSVSHHIRPRDIIDVTVTGVEKAEWDESQHPRHPKGSEDGGEFAPSGGGTAAADDPDADAGAHFDRVVIDDRTLDRPAPITPPPTSGPNVQWNAEKQEYELRPLEPGETAYPPVHPDEPHGARDHMWPQAYRKGGGTVDTSPENVRSPTKTLRYWSTEGSARAQRDGGSPHHSWIRNAADQYFDIDGASPDDSVIDPLTPVEYATHARSMIEGIRRSPPAQPTLWRGIYGPQAARVLAAKVGDDVEWTLGSTSRDPGVAKSYSGTGGGEVRAIMRIRPGARGIANRKHFDHDQEVITGGRFRVVGRSRSKRWGLEIVDLEQIEVFSWDD